MKYNKKEMVLVLASYYPQPAHVSRRETPLTSGLHQAHDLLLFQGQPRGQNHDGADGSELILAAALVEPGACFFDGLGWGSGV